MSTPRPYRLPSFAKTCESLGLVNACQFFINLRFKAIQSWREFYFLRSKRAEHPLAVRPGTSDIKVFDGIFIGVEYECIADLKDIKFVVDCGANVGYSSAFFLSQFKNCEVACVEPDEGNVNVLMNNMAPYGDRVRIYHAGIWSQPAFLKVREVPYRDGDKWALQVEQCDSTTPGSIPAVDIPMILRESGQDRISLLKIDIEGAEVQLFSEGCESWLSKVDNIVIELHDDSCFGPASEIVVQKILDTGCFSVSKSLGEVTVFRSNSR
jgi:FkbM family methyltransferase